MSALSACVGETSDGVWSETPTKTANAESFSARLYEKDGVKPVFGSTQLPTQMVLEALTDFAERLDGGAFIYGGYPSYLVDIEMREEPILGDNIQLTYRVRWLDAGSRRVLYESEALGKCKEAEAIIVFPPRCSWMRRRTLDAALYAL